MADRFWSVEASKWADWLSDYESGTDSRSAAGNNLRKFTAAGRIMETDEGVAAAVPCWWCDRRGHECRLFVDQDKGSRCAYCCRMARANCGALLPPPPPPATAEEQIAALSEQLDTMRTEIGNELAAIKQGFTAELHNLRVSWKKTMSVHLKEETALKKDVSALKKEVKDLREELDTFDSNVLGLEDTVCELMGARKGK